MTYIVGIQSTGLAHRLDVGNDAKTEEIKSNI